MTPAAPPTPTSGHLGGTVSSPLSAENGAAEVSGGIKRWWAAYALLPPGVAQNVTFEIAGGRFTAVTPGTLVGDAQVLPGVVLPGFANAHSHAFHRAMRGRTHDGRGTFWTWRERMYSVAEQLDPDSYLALATATYAEMALAGITAVGEFHYLHHAPGGVSYDDPNVMGEVLRQAAADAGIRLTLLDACYVAGGLSGTGPGPLDPTQKRFSDGNTERWSQRVAGLKETDGMRVGAAIHSVRAVPREQLGLVVTAAAGRPLHVHLSEQPAENEACQGFYGLTPTALLESEGVLGTLTTAVHATHLTTADIATLGRTRTTVCVCPTTERDLADGIGPARRLQGAGSPISLGSDQHAVIDMIEEARALEMHERLDSLQRGRFRLDELLLAATRHDSLGWSDAGRLAVGARADLVAVRLDSPRTAGSAPGQIILSATGADVDTVIVDGRTVVADGQHLLGHVGTMLQRAIEPLWESS